MRVGSTGNSAKQGLCLRLRVQRLSLFSSEAPKQIWEVLSKGIVFYHVRVNVRKINHRTRLNHQLCLILSIFNKLFWDSCLDKMQAASDTVRNLPIDTLQTSLTSTILEFPPPVKLFPNHTPQKELSRLPFKVEAT